MAFLSNISWGTLRKEKAWLNADSKDFVYTAYQLQFNFNL